MSTRLKIGQCGFSYPATPVHRHWTSVIFEEPVANCLGVELSLPVLTS